MRVFLYTIVYMFNTCLCIDHDFKGFDDSILFAVKWPGPQEKIDNLDETTNELPINQNTEVLKVTTSKKETYECHIPSLVSEQPINVKDYDGPTALELLKPLFTQNVCSFRLESYWSYEICHGKFVRQYHEERDGKAIKTQEYYLGRWNAEKQKALEAAQAEATARNIKPMTTKLLGVALPTVEMVFEDGSLCDLNGKPRITRVYYVCYVSGKHEVQTFKETSTCEYEVVILCPLLCEHPSFKPVETEENAIDCRPVGDAPNKPKSLVLMESEAIKLQHHSLSRYASNVFHAPSFSIKGGKAQTKNKEPLAVMKVQKIKKDGMTHLKFELHPLEVPKTAGEGAAGEGAEPELTAAEAAEARRDAEERDNAWAGVDPGEEEEAGEGAGEGAAAPAVADHSPVRGFLNGENCLYGGTGWWKYEFCFEKHVSQYHVSRSGVRTSVVLGVFNKAAHLNWIRTNTEKAPKTSGKRTSISHFYTNGDVCDLTGRPRQTEVKLKCPENESSAAQVSLYLLEPKTCEYILGVESPLICAILPLADDDGLIKIILDGKKDAPTTRRTGGGD